MRSEAKKIIEQALKRPLEERAVIVEELIASLDTEVDVDVEIAWQQEIQKRLLEIKEGRITTIPWEKVRQRLNKHH